MTNKVKSTRKNLSASDYKLTYEGKTAYACYNSEYKYWCLQDSDGGEPTDSMDTLKEVKEAFQYFVDIKSWQ